MSTGFCNLGSLRETLEYLEYGSHVGRWRGEDFVGVVIQGELMLKVLGPWWRWMPPPNPGVVALGVLEVFFATADDFFVGPAIGTKGIVVKTLSPLLVVLAAEGLGVQ